MREAEAVGMKTKTGDWREVVFVAVHRVVHHGVFQLAQVDADLVAATGVQLQVNQRVATACLTHFIVGHGQFAAVVDGRRKNAVLAVGQPRTDLAFLVLSISKVFTRS